MTIKTGPLKLGADVATELGLPASSKLTLGDARVRQLAGKPSGPVKLSDLQGKTKPLPHGTFIRQYCSGYTRMGVYADGNYGTYESAIQYNSPTCGYVPPPAYGTLLSTFCSGYDLYGVYANGSGGSYNSIIEYSSTTCGYDPGSSGTGSSGSWGSDGDSAFDAGSASESASESAGEGEGEGEGEGDGA